MTKIKTSFSGHDKFDCKIDWITKALKAFKEDSTILSQLNIENSIATLGLGINMIKSLNHWMKVLGLIVDNKLTELAEVIIEEDPYLENTDILWILHWNLVKNKEKTTLYYEFFNKFYLYRFTKEELFDKVNVWLDKNIFTKTKDRYTLNINATYKISEDVFIYILNDYIKTRNKLKNESISIDDIQRGELSIQKSLCMSENKLFSLIHKLADLTDNKISYVEASGIRQIYISEQLNSFELLKNILK